MGTGPKFPKIYLIAFLLIVFNAVRFSFDLTLPAGVVAAFCDGMPNFAKGSVECALETLRERRYIDYMVGISVFAFANLVLIIFITLRELTKYRQGWKLVGTSVCLFAVVLFVGPLKLDLIKSQGLRLSGSPLWLMFTYMTGGWIMSLGWALLSVLEPSLLKTVMQKQNELRH